MKWYGLTGGIASGKSTVTQLLKDQGLVVIDADELAKAVVQVGTPGWTQVRAEFGPEFFTASGDLDRKKIGAVVFNEPERLRRLEAILHPLVQAEVLRRRKMLENKGVSFAFYDVPLLFEKNLMAQFDGVVVVFSEESQQIQRMKVNRGYSDSEIISRLKSQRPLKEKVAAANFVVMNTGDLENLKQEVTRLIEWTRKPS